jgi:hypothetical protein
MNLLFLNRFFPIHARHGAAWRSWRMAAALILGMVSGVGAGAPETSVAGRVDFSAFNIINERNIFNAARYRGSKAVGEADRPPRVDHVTLVGTLTYEKGPYAFFDGSSSEFRAVLGPGKSIAGYTVAEIGNDTVKLAAGTNHVELRVGMQLRREEGGEWQVAGSGLAQASSSSSSASSTDSSGNDDGDIVKKLMQQREQELK